MNIVSHRAPVIAWMRRTRASLKDFFGPPASDRSGGSRPASDAMAALRCVHYGRAMFGLHLPQPWSPPTNELLQADGATAPQRDPNARAQLDHAIAGQRE